MKQTLTTLFFLFLFGITQAQSLYFPPLTGSTWETTSPQDLGWCQEKVDSMIDFVGSQDSKAFLVLKDGKLVIEKYYGNFTKDSLWYWASAGKSLTAFLVGVAQENGFLDIDSSSSNYMGTGWTSLSPQQEKAITVRHQLTMTSGLDDAAAGGADCTLPSCLVYKADPGTRWAYHNGPYTLLDSVMENATGQSLNLFHTQNVKSKTGMTGLYVKSGYNNVYFSNARTMARFGLLMLNKGKWDNQVVLGDTAYYNAMVHPSQNLNLAYGYLWWLAGQSSFMLPQSQFVFPGSALPNAPADMFAALGKNGQIINVVPSQQLIVVRMGNPPAGNTALVSMNLDNDIWAHLNDLSCTSSIKENEIGRLDVFPNPTQDVLYLSADASQPFDLIQLLDMQGKEIYAEKYNTKVNVSSLKKGMYVVKATRNNQVFVSRFVKE